MGKLKKILGTVAYGAGYIVEGAVGHSTVSSGSEYGVERFQKSVERQEDYKQKMKDLWNEKDDNNKW